MDKHSSRFNILINFTLVLLLISLFFVASPALPARAADQTVTNTNDSGAGSLRQAVIDVGAGETIYFDSSLEGQVITLLTEISIAKNLTIDGSELETHVQISGGSAARVFAVSGGASVTFTHMDIVDGVASIGGGIDNDNSTVTVNNCKFDTNSADDGGAINNNNGTLTISNSTFYNNSAVDYGGAINNNLGTVTVTGSTFSNNRSDQFGGAIYNNIGTMTLANSTFFYNDALGDGGAAFNWNGTLTFSNCTLSDNYATSVGGIYNSPTSTLHLTNSIVANSSSGAECVNYGTIATNTNNLIEDNSCSPSLSGDPALGGLTHHGGPTETMALGTGSIAIDAGNDGVCESTDQRGAGRWSGAHCDIGAFEYPSLLEVNSVADPGDGTCNTSECTLREAIAVAANGDTITLDTEIPGGMITLGSRLEVTKDLTIDGSDVEPNLVLSGDGSVQVMLVKDGTVSIDHLDFADGVAVIGGGIENFNSTLTLSNCKFDSNNADDGAGINNNNATLNVSKCTFYNNSAVDYGGAINNYQGTVNIKRSTFEENRSNQYGGGIYNTDGTMTVANSTLNLNDSSTAGGGIENWDGTLTVSNSTLSANYAPSGGGIINGPSGTLHMKNTIIADSSTGGDCVNNGTLSTNSNNLIEDNTCSPAVSGDPLLGALANHGGPTETMKLGSGSPAIDAGATCETTDQRGAGRPSGACDIGAYELASLLEVNSVADPGDGICNVSECTLREAITVAANGDTITFYEFIPGGMITPGTRLEVTKDLTIDGSDVVPNLVLSGGSSVQVMFVEDGTVSIDHLDFADGVADIGGGIENFNSTLSLSNCRFDSNSADDGAGINNNNATLNVSDCTFYNNSAVDYGGAINNFQGIATITGSTFSTNRADQYGGAIYNTDGTMTLANSTFFYNDFLTVGGAIENWDGTLTISNSTLSENYAPSGGGLVNGPSGTLHLKNTIIADSSMGGDCVGTLTTNTNNLIEDNTCSPLVSGDPILVPLADNGGPTETMALGSGSIAIDAGATCESTDQRGVSRPQGAQCDIGAFETAPSTIVNSLIDPGDGVCNASECTLREAVNVAAGGDTITFDPTLAGGTITVGQLIILEKELTIDGSSLSSHINVSGGDSVRVFRVEGGATVAIDHLDISQGSSVSGSAIQNIESTVTVSNCTLDSNSADAGGAINNIGTLTVTNCTFVNNHAVDYGAAINNNWGTVTVSGSTFTGNSSDDMGGGIFNNESTVTVKNSTFTGNSATNFGGGIHNYQGTVTVSNSTLSGNSAADGGGILHSTVGTFHLKNTIIANSPSGGDCSNYGTFATNTNNLIEDNTCSPDVSGDPVLLTLTDNGGPTETMALGTGSPAIDAGDNGTCESTDQRGVTRPQGAHCDIGAFEVEVVYPYTLYLPLIMR